MSKKENALYFTYAEAINFKGIEHKVVNIDGRSMIITGKNAANKSSFMQLLFSAIDSKSMPDVIITKGEEHAKAIVKVAGHLDGEDVEYTMETFYSPKNQSGRLVLTNTKGEVVKSPKEVLKGVIGNVSFDVFKFLNDTRLKQIEILKQLSGVGKDIDLLNIEREKIYDNRTFLNRTIKESEAVMNNHNLTQEEIEKYSKPEPTEPIQLELDAIDKSLANWNRVNNGTEAAKLDIEVNIPETIESVCNSIKGLEERIIELQTQIKELKQDNLASEETLVLTKENYQKGLAWLAKNPEPKVKEISDRMALAIKHNENHNKVSDLAEKQKTLSAQKKELAKMESDIESIDAKKNKLIKNSKLPIEGLTFNSENIFIDGLPMDSKQLNTAKLKEISAEISMALNPTLKYIIIPDASLIDTENREALMKKIHDKGYSVIMELVSDKSDMEISFYERDGE